MNRNPIHANGTAFEESTKQSAVRWALALICLTAVAVTGWGQEATGARKSAEQILPLVDQYCGACHAVPRPDVLPKRSWPAVIRAMAEIAQRRMGRVGLSREQMQDIIALYAGSSPEELPMLPHIEETSGTRRFVSRDIGGPSPLPFITHVNASKVTKSADVELLVCDGAAKQLFLLRQARGRWQQTPVANVEIPVHTQVIDVDADDDPDIVVADLGQLPPLEALTGKLFLLRQVSPGTFEKELLQDNLGRVSDARVLDLDADGDLDIAVAVFGGGDVGEVFWLENTGGNGTVGNYKKRPLLELSGAINISPADLNADGRMDLLTLLAQEHEMIVAFINSGAGTFRQGVIARAPHPMFGSTSMGTSDLDSDGDIDILFTNGDAFDAQTDPKPYHGVQWLENKGALEFVFHEIGRFYGASTAAAGDLDRDGDMDVVVGSWINYWDDPRRQALVWYENDGQQRFAPRPIANRPAGVASLQLIDVTGDGVLDIVAGAIRMDLLLAKLGASYKASRLFPSSPDSALHSRVVVFENNATHRSQFK